MKQGATQAQSRAHGNQGRNQGHSPPELERSGEGIEPTDGYVSLIPGVLSAKEGEKVTLALTLLSTDSQESSLGKEHVHLGEPRHPILHPCHIPKVHQGGLNLIV